MYYIYGRVQAIPTYRVYRLYDIYIHVYIHLTFIHFSPIHFIIHIGCKLLEKIIRQFPEFLSSLSKARFSFQCLWNEKVLSYVVHRFASAQKEREFVCEFVLTLYETISKLMVTRNPVGGG